VGGGDWNFGVHSNLTVEEKTRVTEEEGKVDYCVFVSPIATTSTVLLSLVY